MDGAGWRAQYIENGVPVRFRKREAVCLSHRDNVKQFKVKFLTHAPATWMHMNRVFMQEIGCCGNRVGWIFSGKTMPALVISMMFHLEWLLQ